ncbi:TetR/AcrR family transcriptional regulator [Microbacterium tumbae]
MARPRKFDEHSTVQTARDVFRRRGYAATSISDLSEATGLGKGSIYNAFGDKETLYRRAFDDYCRASISTSDAILDDADAGIEAAFAYVHQVVEDTVADEEHIGCMIAKVTTERVPEAPAVLEEASETLRHMESLLGDGIRQGQAVDQIDHALDPDELALLLLCITRGIDALGKAGYTAAELERIEQVSRRLIVGDVSTPAAGS